MNGGEGGYFNRRLLFLFNTIRYIDYTNDMKNASANIKQCVQ
jgi:hypothetical protein